MKHFEKIAHGVDVSHALAEIAQMPIPLARRQDMLPGFAMLVCPFFGRPALWVLLVEALRLLKHPVALGAMVRVTPPGGVLQPHRDRLSREIRRYHLLLQTGPNATFRIGLERKHLAAGELWWTKIGNAVHEVRNPDDISRITLFIDVDASKKGIGEVGPDGIAPWNRDLFELPAPGTVYPTGETIGEGGKQYMYMSDGSSKELLPGGALSND